MTDNIQIFQIYYDEASRAKLDPAFIPYDNSANPRPDWREYWVMRDILLNRQFADDCYIGILSPKFGEKTHISGDEMTRRVASSHADVISFSPFLDQGCLYLNPFEHGEYHHPGMIDVTSELLTYLDIPIDPMDLVCDVTTTIFSNFFVARHAVWKRWLEVTERIFELCENSSSNLSQRLNKNTTYPLPVALKVFIMERLISVLLVHWNMHAELGYDIEHATMAMPGAQHTLDSLLVADSLKGQYLKTGDRAYLELFWKLTTAGE